MNEILKVWKATKKGQVIIILEELIKMWSYEKLETSASYCSNDGQDNTQGEIVEQLNNILDGVSSNISSDENDPSVTENSSPPPSPHLSKEQHKVMKSAKCITELCEEIQSLGQYAKT